MNSYDDLIDILVANRFGRLSNGLFIGNNVSVGEDESCNRFYIYAKTKNTETALTRLFSDDASIEVIPMTRVQYEAA